MHYPAKISTTCTIIEEELKDAFQLITRTWLEEVNREKLKKRSPSQLSVLKSFIPKYGLQYPNIAQLLQILLSARANTSPVKRGFTYLERVASERRKHLYPENLDTLFLLSALKVPIKSVTSYQAEIEYLEEAQLSFGFLILQLCKIFFKCVLISSMEIKPFASLKNESSLFWTSVYLKL